jgi:hypothetical protein
VDSNATATRPPSAAPAAPGGQPCRRRFGHRGLTAACLLRRTHEVILFEAEHRLGGHAHTQDVTDSDSRQHAVDSGFNVPTT